MEGPAAQQFALTSTGHPSLNLVWPGRVLLLSAWPIPSERQLNHWRAAAPGEPDWPQTAAYGPWQGQARQPRSSTSTTSGRQFIKRCSRHDDTQFFSHAQGTRHPPQRLGWLGWLLSLLRPIASFNAGLARCLALLAVLIAATGYSSLIALYATRCRHMAAASIPKPS